MLMCKDLIYVMFWCIFFVLFMGLGLEDTGNLGYFLIFDLIRGILMFGVVVNMLFSKMKMNGWLEFLRMFDIFFCSKLLMLCLSIYVLYMCYGK